MIQAAGLATDLQPIVALLAEALLCSLQIAPVGVLLTITQLETETASLAITAATPVADLISINVLLALQATLLMDSVVEVEAPEEQEVQEVQAVLVEQEVLEEQEAIVLRDSSGLDHHVKAAIIHARPVGVISRQAVNLAEPTLTMTVATADAMVVTTWILLETVVSAMEVAELAMDNLLTLVQAAETHQYCSETDHAAAIQDTSTLLAITARAVTHLVGPVGDLKITNVHHATGVPHLEASVTETETSQETQEEAVIQTNTTTVPAASHAIALVQPALALEQTAVYHATIQQTIIWPHTAADVLKDIS